MVHLDAVCVVDAVVGDMAFALISLICHVVPVGPGWF